MLLIISKRPKHVTTNSINNEQDFDCDKVKFFRLYNNA